MEAIHLRFEIPVVDCNSVRLELAFARMEACHWRRGELYLGGHWVVCANGIGWSLGGPCEWNWPSWAFAFLGIFPRSCGGLISDNGQCRFPRIELTLLIE